MIRLTWDTEAARRCRWLVIISYSAHTVNTCLSWTTHCCQLFIIIVSFCFCCCSCFIHAGISWAVASVTHCLRTGTDTCDVISHTWTNVTTSTASSVNDPVHGWLQSHALRQRSTVLTANVANGQRFKSILTPPPYRIETLESIAKKLIRCAVKHHRSNVVTIQLSGQTLCDYLFFISLVLPRSDP